MANNSECCPCCQQSSYLPARSFWVRTMLSKIENDQNLENIDRRKWYRLLRRDLLRDDFRELFHELNEDADTTAFLEQSQAKSDNIPVQILHSLASSVLNVFIARTSGIFRLSDEYCPRKLNSSIL